MTKISWIILQQESLTGLLMEQIRNSQEEMYSVNIFTLPKKIINLHVLRNWEKSVYSFSNNIWTCFQFSQEMQVSVFRVATD